MPENKRTITLIRIDFVIAIVLLVIFLTFLILSSTRAPLNFDASYNMLPYQSSFQGHGFQYTYDGKSVPFNPEVSTGPELYLPALIIWKIIGHTDYFIASYVLIGYYAAFLVFLLFYVLKSKPYKTLALLIFLLLLFLNKNLFDNYSLIDPLGELPASFLIFTGVYLFYRKKIIPAFFLFGLALDVKSNVIIALIPVLAIYIFLAYIWPLLKSRSYEVAAKTSLKWALISLILIVPALLTTRILPELTLNAKEKAEWQSARQDWNKFRIKRGMGQLINLAKHPDRHTLEIFWTQTMAKITTLKSFFGNSSASLLLFYASLFYLAYYTYRRKHFSLLLFAFSIFFSLWWIFMGTDAWWRYFLLVEWMYILGIVALTPLLFGNKNFKKYPTIFAALVVAIVFLPQFSLASIRQSLDPSERNDFTKMQKLIEPIDQNNIFTYGWFQCPQLMLLTGKRFQDYTDQPKVNEASKRGGSVYLLTSVEDTIVQPEMDEILKSFDLVKAFGYNNLYKLR